eukprot:scaffold77919_cov63-Phaeocystis_antarctica.AAC.4
MSVISRNVICTTSLPWNPASRRAEERRLQFGHAIGRGLVVGWWLAGGRRWAWVGGRTGRCTGLDLHPLIRDLVARPRLPREGGREGDDAHHREERQAGDEGLRDRGRALEERLLRDELLRRRGRGRALLLRALLLDLLPVRGRVLRRLRVVGHLRRARPHHGAMRAQGRGRKDDGASERERAREELYEPSQKQEEEGTGRARFQAKATLASNSLILLLTPLTHAALHGLESHPSVLRRAAPARLEGSELLAADLLGDAGGQADVGCRALALIVARRERGHLLRAPLTHLLGRRVMRRRGRTRCRRDSWRRPGQGIRLRPRPRRAGVGGRRGRGAGVGVEGTAGGSSRAAPEHAQLVGRRARRGHGIGPDGRAHVDLDRGRRVYLVHRGRHAVVPPVLGHVVVVDQVAHVPPAPVHRPVVTVEGLGREPGVVLEPRLNGQLVGSAHEAEQLGRVALVLAQGLPLEHLQPGVLVHVVVDGDHRRHRLLLHALALALAVQRVEEHLLRRIDPVALGVGAARDRRLDALLREVPALVLRLLLVRRRHHVARVDVLGRADACVWLDLLLRAHRAALAAGRRGAGSWLGASSWLGAHWAALALRRSGGVGEEECRHAKGRRHAKERCARQRGW